MSQQLPGPPPSQAVNAYAMVDPDTKGPWIGGSYDTQTTVVIACAFYQARQRYDVDPSFLIGVFDASDTPVAFIGDAAAWPLTEELDG